VPADAVQALYGWELGDEHRLINHPNPVLGLLAEGVVHRADSDSLLIQKAEEYLLYQLRWTTSAFEIEESLFKRQGPTLAVNPWLPK
jgi:hypothetical protein